MKKNFKKMIMVVIAIVGMVMVSGCGWRHNDTTKVKEINNVDYVVEFEYEGHEYIMFMEKGNNNFHNMTGVVHNPNCHCHNE